MKTLKDILYKVSLTNVVGETDVLIKGITLDSRKVEDGFVFIAIKGSTADGHNYINSALGKGAGAIVCEHMPETLEKGITYVKVADGRAAASQMAANFFNEPSKDIKLIGITGTNGKTTIATLLYQLFSGLGYRSGLISTIENRIGEKVLDSNLTTPDVISLNALLAEMVAADYDFAFMEVSSHAIDQQRNAGLEYAGGVFTNLTHDHLDYHGSFKEYRDVKKKFFDGLPKEAFALTNADDKNGEFMLQNTKAKKFTYGLRNMAQYKVRILENSFEGLFVNVDGTDVYTPLIGDFNALNLLAVYAVATLLDCDRQEVLRVLSTLPGASGRFEYVISENDKIVGIVDYAHTPDALLKVLSTIGSIRSGNESLITLVGCGGNRDKTKRPLMAEVAAEHSNKVILTSDNPRNEEPEAIIEDMKQGIGPVQKPKTLSIVNRREAIRTACTLAEPKDIILVAGKGHENYQEIKGERFPFDDKEELLKAFKELQR